MELYCQLELGNGGAGPNWTYCALNIMLRDDAFEKNMNNVEHVDFSEAKCDMIILLSFIIYKGNGLKHCDMKMVNYVKYYVVLLVKRLVEYVKLPLWRA